MYGYVYKNTYLVTGLSYIGRHKYDKPELDTDYHGSGEIWTKIYKKHKGECIEEIIDIADSEEELQQKERYWIAKLNTKHPNGYNLKDGGESGVLVEESKKKISDALKGKLFTENRINNISKAVQSYYDNGGTAWNKGIKMSEEFCKNVSEANINNPKLSKIVLQYSKDGKFIKEWPSTAEVERVLHIRHISECCNGYRKTSGGFIWKYKKDIC